MPSHPRCPSSDLGRGKDPRGGGLQAQLPESTRLAQPTTLEQERRRKREARGSMMMRGHGCCPTRSMGSRPMTKEGLRPEDKRATGAN